ncbi:MAG: TetR/AcrR family transcriptional regulator [Pseudomonadota bacterium]
MPSHPRPPRKTSDGSRDARRQPRQRRARQTVEAIVEAAARVLIERGPAGLTTNHIAERAGVSIGSLYQYFPNKGAILAALQKQEMTTTLGSTAAILNDVELEPIERVRAAIHHFFQSEAQESELRRALVRAEVFFESDPSNRASRAMAIEQIHSFLVANGLHDSQDRFFADLLMTTTASVAEAVTSRGEAVDLSRWADAVFAMVTKGLGRD